jgi:hypothetical protein
MARKRKTLDDQYRPHLARFFSWRDGIKHPNTFMPPPDAFNGITPQILTRYLRFLATQSTVAPPVLIL